MGPRWIQRRMKNLNYMKIVFCIRYSKLSGIYLKKHREKMGNLSITIYLNKIENRITF